MNKPKTNLKKNKQNLKATILEQKGEKHKETLKLDDSAPLSDFKYSRAQLHWYAHDDTFRYAFNLVIPTIK